MWPPQAAQRLRWDLASGYIWLLSVAYRGAIGYSRAYNKLQKPLIASKSWAWRPVREGGEHLSATAGATAWAGSLGQHWPEATGGQDWRNLWVLLFITLCCPWDCVLHGMMLSIGSWWPSRFLTWLIPPALWLHRAGRNLPPCPYPQICLGKQAPLCSELLLHLHVVL